LTVASRLFQLDLSVCSGNSGWGGLFNERGEVVGLVHAMIQTEQVLGNGGCSRMAFAIPTAVATGLSEISGKGGNRPLRGWASRWRP
jgi:serine protease Do